jgi:signal transduction histidine kinase
MYESFGISIPINFEFYVNYPWYFQFWALAIWFSIIALVFYLSFSYRAKFLENKYLAITETRRQQLYQIIAHDLRSPLNHFSDLLNIVKFLIQKNRLEDLKTVTSDLNKSAQSIDLILSNLLGLTHPDYIEIKTETINLKEFFFVICEPYKLIAEAKNLTFDFEFYGLSHFVSNKMAISILTRNLIDNAVKHGMTKIKIEVINNNYGNKLLLNISNDFDNKHLYSLSLIKELISKNKQIETGEVGTGLGLVLISKSILVLGGKISVKTKESNLVIKVLLTNMV